MTMDTDGQGFLWIGTQNGLARWDGLHFRIYNAGDKPGQLPDGQIEIVHTDQHQRLWIGTSSGGLARFDPGTGRFLTYTVAKDGLSHMAVHALADAPHDGLWIGTEAGLDHLTAGGQIVHAIASGPQQASTRKALSSGVFALTSKDHDLWIGTQEGLLHMDIATGAITMVRITGKDQPRINALLSASDGRLWVGTEGQGAYVVEPKTLKVSAVAASEKGGGNTLGMLVRALTEVVPGEIWLGTYHDGIQTVDARTLAVRPVRAGNGALLYADQSLRALHRAPSGLIFVAGNSAITRYDPRRKAFSTLMGGSAPTAVLSERTPVSVFEAPEGRIWIGFMSHGIDRLDPATGRIEHLPPSQNGLPKAAIRTYAQLPNGDVLVGTDQGLYSIGRNGKKIDRLAQPGRADDARVQSVQLSDETVWIGGLDGLWRYRLGAGHRLNPDFAVPFDSLSDRRVDVTSLEANGDLWIGTDNGLNRFVARTGNLEQIKPQSGDEATPRGFISSIMTDRAGRLWVSTYGRGLSVSDPPIAGRSLKFRRIDVADGLPNSNVNKVIEDRSGYIWASTDTGLVRIDSRTLHIDVYRAAEGVPVSSFFYNAGLRTKQGEVLFGGRGGLVVIRPDLVKPINDAPRLVVTSVRLRGQMLESDPFLARAGTAVRLPPGGGGLEVGFAALDYAAADRVQYAYRLVRGASGHEPWVETDATRPSASFTNLDPGVYHLEIRASDPTGAWLPQYLHLPISVRAAWFQTLWFKAFLGILLLAGVFALIRLRTGHLQHRRRELEDMVEDRTQALRDQTMALEAQAIVLAQTTARAEALTKAKSDFLANMSHEIRTPLNGVVAVADMLTRSGLAPKEQEMAEIIRASGDTLQRLLSDILDTARIESGKITIEAAPFHAGAMIRAVAGLSQLKCDEKGIQLEINIGPEVDQFVMGDVVRVRQIVTNLLSNAVKFTDAGVIKLTAERTAAGLVRLTVADSGVGFAMADKGKVLGRFEQADTSITRKYGGTGLGLSICCDLAALMGGALDCSSDLGVGSRFWIELPLQPTEAAPEAELAEFTGGAVTDEEMSPPRILLADDHPTNRKVVELMLGTTGAELVMAGNGAEALDAFGRGTFDVILMDMQMPVMDGLTAIRRIRQEEQDKGLTRTPVIMLTANALPEHVTSALAAGADMHMSKPFTAPVLFERLEAALALRDEAREAA